MEIIPGVRASVTAPYTYEMTYLDGKRTYRDPFLLLRVSKEIVNDVQSVIDEMINSMCSQLESAPPVYGIPVGQILAFAMKAGNYWYKYASRESDGSIVLQFAQHYVGTKAGGVDITAGFGPIGIVDPNAWQRTLNAAMKAVSGQFDMAPIATLAVETVSKQPTYVPMHMEVALLEALLAEQAPQLSRAEIIESISSTFGYALDIGTVKGTQEQRGACYKAAASVRDQAIKEVEKIDDWIQRSAAIAAAWAAYGAACWACDQLIKDSTSVQFRGDSLDELVPLVLKAPASNCTVVTSDPPRYCIRADGSPGVEKTITCTWTDSDGKTHTDSKTWCAVM